MPADLLAALAADPLAAAMAGLDARNSFALGFRLRGVKRPETRARKIAVARLARGERIY